MVLKEIFKQPPSSILIEDSWEIKGRPLFLSLIKCYSENGFKIHYLKYDSCLSCEKEQMKGLDIQIERPNWNTDNLAIDLLNAWRLTFAQGFNLIIAIDSLSPLLLHCPIKDIVAIVKEMAQRKVPVICLLHGDAHQRYDITQLDYVFSCHLSIKKIFGKDVCRGMLKNPGGKVLDADEYYTVDPTWKLSGIEEVKNVTSPESVEAVKAPVPKSTFKLDLNPNEEKARSQVVLPYLRKLEKQDEKKSQIFYEAEQPDWEDEDPDDDLEI